MKNLVAVLCSISLFLSSLIVSAHSVNFSDLFSPSDSVLIKNVRLISREDSLGDVVVSLLVIDKKLQLVTKDDIHLGSSVTQFDGKGGFLMGSIAIGEVPSLVILDENPRTNFDIFLNTGSHVVFAMNDGEIVVNKLESLKQESLTKKAKLTWSAYAPPPMAVPINYYNAKKWNKFENKFMSGLFNGCLALDRLRWTSQDATSESQVGDLELTSLGELRVLRFGLIGTFKFKKPWVYTVFFTNNTFDRGYDSKTDNSLMLYDLRVDIPLPSNITLSVGKQKEPISMERLTTLLFLPWQERQAAADAFLPARNVGALLNGTVANQRATWAAGVFRNWIESDTTFAATPTQVTGRITGVPYLSKDESNLLHLGAGLRYSNAKLPVKGKTEAEFFLSPVFIETAKISADNFITYDLEAYWRKGPYLLGFEFIGNKISSATDGDSNPFGYNISGSWVVTGEMRPYRKRSGIFDPVPVSKPIGYKAWGALEVGVRYSMIQMNQANIAGGDMRTFSIGANWWLTQKVQFGVNQRFITLDRFDTSGKTSGLNFRLMLILD